MMEIKKKDQKGKRERTTQTVFAEKEGQVRKNEVARVLGKKTDAKIISMTKEKWVEVLEEHRNSGNKGKRWGGGGP